MIVERTLKSLNASPQGRFWRHCKEDFSAYVTNLTPEEADVLQGGQLYRKRADAESSGARWTGANATCRAAVRAGGEHQNVFDELKNQWGFVGFCSQKAAVSRSSARMLLLVYNL